MISIEDFKKLDIRVGKVLSADRIEGSDKLLKIMFDVGEESPRQVLAGIAEVTPEPSSLVGKEIPVVLNLEPRKLRGETSYGMILAADGGSGPVLLHPAEEIPPGSIVK